MKAFLILTLLAVALIAGGLVWHMCGYQSAPEFTPMPTLNGADRG